LATKADNSGLATDDCPVPRRLFPQPDNLAAVTDAMDR